MMAARIVLTAMLLIGLPACDAPGERHSGTIMTLAPPVGTGSMRPTLARDPSGGVLLSWTEHAAGEDRASGSKRIAWSVYDGVRWSKPTTFVQRDDLFTNWADVQRLSRTTDGTLIGLFGTTVGPTGLATNLVIARQSTDGSERLEDLVHRDGTATQHGFAAMVETERGPWLVWLDGRETLLDEGVTNESEWGEMSLRAARLSPGGEVTDEQSLDDRVCDCCPTAGVRTSRGALFAYRDRGPDETRDIHLIRLDPDGFTEPYPLHDDGWIINGCPVNGPALASEGDRVVAAWFTAADDRPRVLSSFSPDGGRTFSDPVTIDAARPHGRAGVALLPDGTAAVSWIGREEGGRVVYVAKVSSSTPGPARIAARPLSPAFTGIPSIAPLGDGVIVAWTDGPHPDSTRVKAAFVEL